MIRCSIVIPAFNEDKSIETVMNRIRNSVSIEFECFVVVDSEEDKTIAVVEDFFTKDSRFKIIINRDGQGPAYAIRRGIRESKAKTVVVTMADGSDDPRDIEELCLLVERGVDIACASRYMPTGQQIGAPFIKSIFSKYAGKSLYWFARVGTRDATNSFKAYSREFLSKIDIQAKYGFEMGIELVAKAKRGGYLVAEIPTIWIERSRGNSRFKIFRWIPKYLKWYFFAFRIG